MNRPVKLYCLILCYPLARILSIRYISTKHGQWTSAFQFVHHLADIAQASPAFGVFHRALTISKFLFGLDFFHDRGAPIPPVILLDIFSSEAKTVTNHFAHVLNFSFLNTATQAGYIPLK
jgi:hypothetical protein